MPRASPCPNSQIMQRLQLRQSRGGPPRHSFVFVSVSQNVVGLIDLHKVHTASGEDLKSKFRTDSDEERIDVRETLRTIECIWTSEMRADAASSVMIRHLVFVQNLVRQIDLPCSSPNDEFSAAREVSGE